VNEYRRKVTGLRVSAKIVKAAGAVGGAASVEIYGMTRSLMNQLSTLGKRLNLVPPNTMIIEAGDVENGMTTVFIGNVADAYADFQNAPQVAFRVTGKSGLVDAPIATSASSYPGAVDVATIMASLALRMGKKFENNGVSVILHDQYL
jgi:hypothetical protein